MVDPLSATIGAGEGLSAIAERLGLLDKLKRKLMKQPDAASAKLETVLIELSKVYGVLDVTVNDYMGLWLLRDKENSKWREEVTKLRRYASGRHEADMRKAKGDCQKIWSIYVAYLNPWFTRALNKRVLSKKEAEELFLLFRELSGIDSVMVDAIDATASWLTKEASETLALVQSKNYGAADQRVQEAWTRWEPFAATLRESMKRLYDLRASLIEVSRAV